MSTEHFRVTYDGPALESHEMDVRDLAPALLALADACEASGQVLFGAKSKVVVNVKASFKTGSFGVDMTLATNILKSLVGWFSGPDGQALANAATIIGGLGLLGGGVIWAIKRLRGRKIKRIDVRGTKRILLTEDDEEIEIEEYVLLLMQNRSVREHLDRVLSPLDRDGITKVAFGSDQTVESEILKSERPYFVVPASNEELLFSEERVQAFSIVSLAFRDGNKWRMYDGQAVIHVSIEDAEFLARVNQDIEQFTKSDVLICRIRVTQWQTDHGVKAEYAILRVLDHKRGAQQLKLDY
jgi:hypothetical protein